MKHKLKIETHGTTASVYLDGKRLDDKLRGYTVEQDAGGIPIVTLQFVATDVEIDADEVDVDDAKDECVQSCGNCSHLIFCNCPSPHFWCDENKDCPCNGDETPNYKFACDKYKAEDAV